MNRANRGRRVPIWTVGPKDELRPVIVKLGLSDGVSTEVDGKINQGDKIITGAEVDANRTTTTTTRAPGFGGPMGFRGGR